VLGRVATGQIQVHFGVEAGVPLTDTLASSSQSSNTVIPMGLTSGTSSFFDRYSSETKRLLIGPAFRVEMQSGLGIEIDALYQRIDYDHAIITVLPGAGAPNTRSFEQTTANRWQFPLLIQYNGTLSKTKFFAEAGPSISRIANSRSTISSINSTGSSTTSSTSSVTGQGGTLAGITAGAGVDLPFFHQHLRPEFRYSHWFSPSAGAVVVQAALFITPATFVSVSPTFRTNQNEATFLLGLTF